MPAIVLLGSWARFHALDRQSIWTDEAISVTWASQDVATAIRTTAQDVHPPLHYILLHFWIQAVGQSEFAVRALSAFLGILAIPLIYRLGQDFRGRLLGLIASLLAALSSYLIYYSQEARAYSLLFFLSLGSFYAFIKFLRQADYRWGGAYILVTALMLYTQVYAFTLLAVQNLSWGVYYFWTKTPPRLGWRHWGLTQGAILILFAPWLLTLINQIQTVQQEYWLPKPTGSMLLGHYLLYAGSIPLALTIIVIAVSVAIWRLWPKHSAGSIPAQRWRSGVLLSLWLTLPHLIPIVISLIGQPIYLHRGAISALAAFYLGLAWLLVLSPLRARLIFFSALCLFQIADLPRLYQQIDKEQWREVTQLIESEAQPGDLILIYPGGRRIAFDYYFRRIDLNVFEINLPTDFQKISAGPAPIIWLVVIPFDVKAPIDPNLFAPRYQWESTLHFWGIDLYKFKLSSASRRTIHFPRLAAR